MEYRKIVLAGGKGYLGQVLGEYYRPLSEEVIVLSRKSKAPDGNIKTVVWDGRSEGDWVQALEGADMLVNLCGKNVNCRYTRANQAAIIHSRVVPTTLLGKVIGNLAHPPKLWINVTSATIYRHAEDKPQEEENGDIGYGFSIEVCRRWEEAFFEANTPRTRKIALRMGIVLGRRDGAFPRLLNLVRCGLGGRQGEGQQYVSWVHEQDAARCTEWLLRQEHLQGVMNCTAPEPVKNAELMAHIRRAWGMPWGLPTPAWLLTLGARIIGTEPELILKSRWVLPRRLLDSGYPFLFSQARHAVNDLISLRL
ncbi:MAG: TIGR01777 family oxidoreductase [Adhaeribacter sp.]